MSQKTINLINRSSAETLLTGVKWCSSFWCKFIGYQFRRRLKPGQALIMVYERDSTRNTSIHMLFVFFPLAVVWINSQGWVTSVQLAQPWRFYYGSPEPARYVLETTPDFIDRIAVGDQVDFIY